MVLLFRYRAVKGVSTPSVCLFRCSGNTKQASCDTRATLSARCRTGMLVIPQRPGHPPPSLLMRFTFSRNVAVLPCVLVCALLFRFCRRCGPWCVPVTGPEEEVHRQKGVIDFPCGAPVAAGQGKRGRRRGFRVRPDPVRGKLLCTAGTRALLDVCSFLSSTCVR